MAIDFLDQLATYLQAQSIGTAGTNIFVNKLPDTTDNCVALIGQPGPSIGPQRDVARLQFPRFQAIIRNVDYNDGSDKFQAVRTALHGKVGLVLPTSANPASDENIRILRCHAESEGGPIGEDEQGRVEFSINFQAEYIYDDPA